MDHSSTSTSVRGRVTQRCELKRVRDRIRHHLLKWWAARIASGALEFHGVEIVDAVMDMVAAEGSRITPDSVTRIMRDLRKHDPGKNIYRQLYYELLSRPESRYRIVPLDSVEYRWILAYEQ